jgi:hypothetical protein
MALRWRFRCYLTQAGDDDVRAWYESETKQVQAKFASRLKTLGQLPRNEWHETLFKELHGKCAGIAEIRFKADNVQQRPLGFRSGESEFTILFCATEKSDRFIPRNACEIALARRVEVLANRRRTNALWLALE